MYIIAAKIADSPIEVKGVFSLETIQKSKIVWLFKEGHDIRKIEEDFDILSPDIKDYMGKTTYLSPWSGL
jgi:hypothetical protein